MPTKRRGPESQHLSTTGVIGEIDRRLTELDLELESTRPLIDERRRLLRARATLSGDPSSPAGNLVRKVTQDEVATISPAVRDHGLVRSHKSWGCP